MQHSTQHLFPDLDKHGETTLCKDSNICSVHSLFMNAAHDCFARVLMELPCSRVVGMLVSVAMKGTKDFAVALL